MYDVFHCVRLNGTQLDEICNDEQAFLDLVKCSDAQCHVEFNAICASGLCWLLSPTERLDTEIQFSDSIDDEDERYARMDAIVHDDFANFFSRSMNYIHSDIYLADNVAYVTDAATVQRLTNECKHLDEPSLRSKFNAQEISDKCVYLDWWWLERGDAAFTDFLHPEFMRLREFLHTASIHDQAIVHYHTDREVDRWIKRENAG